MIEGLGIAIIGALVISRIIVDIWPFLMPGRLGAKFGAEAKKGHQRHPVGYWLERILMMAIGAWIVIVGVGVIGISN